MKGLGADEEYWKALEQGVIKMQQCVRCGTWNWPAVWRCGECGSWDHRWNEVAPRGRIFSWTRNWHDFGWPSPQGLPYVPVVVELDDAGGHRLLGVLDDPKAEVHIGQRVSGSVTHITWDGESLPALRWSLAPDTATTGGTR
jgi:hypothetical protein